MNLLWIVIGTLVFILLVLIIFFVKVYNNIVELKNKYLNGWSQIRVQLNRRYDLIPNLVNAVKGYLKHEQETLQKVIEARNMAANSKSIKDTIQNDNVLADTLKSLFMVVENYPDLKANQNVMQLQEELVSTENRISYARQHYNDMVMEYNTVIQTFPNNILSNILNFKEEVFFEVEDSKKLEVPEVRF